jgi:hypothetical protein
MNAPRGYPLCAYTTLVADGTLCPLFLTMKQKIPPEVHFIYPEDHLKIERVNTPKKEMPGEVGVMKYLEYHESLDSFQEGDILITDNERSFNTPKVLEKMLNMGILKLNFPVGMGHLMNPCDNEFHNEMKKRYYLKLSDLDSMKAPLSYRIEAIYDAYYDAKEESVQKYFVHNGILGTEDPTLVSKRLLNKGIYPAKKFENFHKAQIEKYRLWKLQNPNVLI